MPIMQTHARYGLIAPGMMGRAACLLFERLYHTKLFANLLKRQLTGTIAAVPPMIHSGNPEQAKLAYYGEFAFKSGTLKTGAISPFHVPNLSDALACELNSFTWLRHLQSTDNEISRAHARRLISDWITTRRQNRSQAWQPHITARRLTSWLTAAPFYLKNAPADFNDKLLGSILTQTTFLAFTAHRTGNADERLEALIGLAITTLCFEGKTQLLSKTLAHLKQELHTQILPDGGHVSRTPSSVLKYLGDLIILRETMITRNYIVPKSLISAIDRMLPMLRFFQLGDRGLAYFHGNNEPLTREVARILGNNPKSGRPLGHARHSGYQRLDLGKTIIIMDTAQPPSSSPHENIHASCLAFEMSCGANRIIVNCGAADDPMSDWYEAACSTAAHSTLTLNEANQNFTTKTSLWRKWLSAEPTVAKATSSRSDNDGNIMVEAEHDGYLDRFGLRHKRTLYLSHKGHDLRGEDIVRQINTGMFARKPQAQSFAIRFHIHPDVKVTRSQNTHSVLLLLPDRTGWTFTTAGAELELTESAYLTGQNSPKRSQQIVLHGSVKKHAQIKWALKRLDKTKKPKHGKIDEPGYLPLIDV